MRNGICERWWIQNRPQRDREGWESELPFNGLKVKCFEIEAFSKASPWLNSLPRADEDDHARTFGALATIQSLELTRPFSFECGLGSLCGVHRVDTVIINA
jgi:hypothetical protein